MSNQQAPQELPTREEVIAWYNEQIELAKLRLELAELQSKAAIADAQRMQAVGMIAQMQGAEPTEPTQEDADEAPKARSLKKTT